MSQKSTKSRQPRREIYKLKQTHENRKPDAPSGLSKRRRVLQSVSSKNSRDASEDLSAPKISETVYAIDYSPRSKFLRKLKQNGRIVRKSPRVQKSCPSSPPSLRTHKPKTKDVGTSPVKSHKVCPHSPQKQRRTKDTGTDPPTFRSPRSPRTKDVGTDPPSFRENQPPKKKETKTGYFQRASAVQSTSKFVSPRPTSLQSYKSVCEDSCHALSDRERQIGSAIVRDLPAGFEVHCGLNCNARSSKDTLDCPLEAMHELRDFRQAHWFDCHADADKLRTLSNHKCCHKYILNERMLPQPTKVDLKGRSLCGKCGLPAAVLQNSESKHEVVMDSMSNPSKKVTFDIPNPYQSQPILRSTVESRNKISIPTAPTLSYIPHYPQRLGKPLQDKEPCKTQLRRGCNRIRHTVYNCYSCMNK